MFNENLDSIVAGIAKNYSATEIFFTDPDKHFPNKRAIINIIKDLRRVMFPRYFGDETPTGTNPEYFIGETLIRIEDSLRRQLKEALLFKGAENISEEEVEARVNEICKNFFEKLPEIQRVLLTDVQAAFDGDPAAQSKEEIIFSYPGFFAIFVYRIAHELYTQNVPLIPRIMTEYAHSGTGVDINAGAIHRRILLYRPCNGCCHRRNHCYRQPCEDLPRRNAWRSFHSRGAKACWREASPHHRR